MFVVGAGAPVNKSQRAVIVAVVWGQCNLLIRFSIVKHDVPFLISKHVCLRLGAVVDFHDNVLILKRVGHVKEALHDLDTGHVGVELVKRDCFPPHVDKQSLVLALNGSEIVVG